MHRHSSKQVTSPTEMEINALNAYWSLTLDCGHEKDYTEEGKVLQYNKHEKKQSVMLNVL